jgi:hypothetical protein
MKAPAISGTTIPVVVIVPVPVVRCVQCQKIAVGPEETVGKTHDQSGHKYADGIQFRQRHHGGHGDTTQKHPEGVQACDGYVLEQPAVDTKSDRDTGIESELEYNHQRQVAGVPHDIGPDKELNNGHHQTIHQVGEKEHAHPEWLRTEEPQLFSEFTEHDEMLFKIS